MCQAEASFVPIAEAAQFLETTGIRVLMMLKKNGQLGKMVDGVWYVDRLSLLLCGRPEVADIIKPGCGSGCAGCGGH